MPKRLLVPTSNAPIGIAGVHYVAAELSRRGMVTSHMETALRFLVVPTAFCRTEIEERLVAEIPGLPNSRGQRGA